MLPFQNESEVLQIEGLTLENRLDRVEFYGSLQLTMDKVGLSLALLLKSELDQIVSVLKGSELPDVLPKSQHSLVKNPFE